MLNSVVGTDIDGGGTWPSIEVWGGEVPRGPGGGPGLPGGPFGEPGIGPFEPHEPREPREPRGGGEPRIPPQVHIRRGGGGGGRPPQFGGGGPPRFGGGGPPRGVGGPSAGARAGGYEPPEPRGGRPFRLGGIMRRYQDGGTVEVAPMDYYQPTRLTPQQEQLMYQHFMAALSRPLAQEQLPGYRVPAITVYGREAYAEPTPAPTPEAYPRAIPVSRAAPSPSGAPTPYPAMEEIPYEMPREYPYEAREYPRAEPIYSGQMLANPPSRLSGYYGELEDQGYQEGGV